MYIWIDIKGPADFENLSHHLAADEFGLRYVIEQLQLHMSPVVGGLCIEYPYVDKDYRSTYYNYYAKKGGSYSPHCARLHFFCHGWSLKDGPLRFVDPDGNDVSGDIDKGYLGFVVVRPTRIYTLGRSVVSPKAVRGVSGRLIGHRHKAHILGNKVTVHGFPYMQQHSDIAVCAHAACWAILRHYSERYALYSEVLLHDVSRLGREFDPGGLLPSMGITYVDAERIFAAVGTYPLFIPRRDHHRFYSQLVAYLDSGFPLFGVQTGRGHAIAIAGYKAEDHPQAGAPVSRATLWDYVSNLLVIDDNYFPYMPVPRQKVKDRPYGIDAIDGFIVPLPEKMFLPASAVIELSNEIVEAPVEHFEELENEPDLVIRHFLTTTAAWHRHIRQTVGVLPPDFSKLAFELAMPQFVWVVEYSTPAQWKAGYIQTRLLLDATAGTHEVFPAFLMHDQKGALWLDRASRRPMAYQQFQQACGSLDRMDSNLARY